MEAALKSCIIQKQTLSCSHLLLKEFRGLSFDLAKDGVVFLVFSACTGTASCKYKGCLFL